MVRFRTCAWLIAAWIATTDPLVLAEDIKATIERLAAPMITSELVAGMMIGVVQGDRRTVVRKDCCRTGSAHAHRDFIEPDTGSATWPKNLPLAGTYRASIRSLWHRAALAIGRQSPLAHYATIGQDRRLAAVAERPAAGGHP